MTGVAYLLKVVVILKQFTAVKALVVNGDTMGIRRWDRDEVARTVVAGMVVRRVSEMVADGLLRCEKALATLAPSAIVDSCVSTVVESAVDGCEGPAITGVTDVLIVLLIYGKKVWTSHRSVLQWLNGLTTVERRGRCYVGEEKETSTLI